MKRPIKRTTKTNAMKNYKEILNAKLNAYIAIITTGKDVKYPRKDGGYDVYFRPAASDKAIQAAKDEAIQAWDEAARAGQNNWECTFDQAVILILNNGW